jgi:hypothetical protein
MGPMVSTLTVVLRLFVAFLAAFLRCGVLRCVVAFLLFFEQFRYFQTSWFLFFVRFMFTDASVTESVPPSLLIQAGLVAFSFLALLSCFLRRAVRLLRSLRSVAAFTNKRFQRPGSLGLFSLTFFLPFLCIRQAV